MKTNQSLDLDGIEEIKAIYQPVDCDNTPVGEPIFTLPVIVANNIQSKICNTVDITAPIIEELTNITDKLSSDCTNPINVNVCNSGGVPVTSYNNNEQIVLEDTATTTLAANTYHSISIAIISGAANITIDGITLLAPAGYTKQLQASTLLVNSITVAGTIVDSLIAIDTIN